MLATLYKPLALVGALVVSAALVAAAASPAPSSSSDFTNNWAVLVCTSRFWFNYRHIANTLAMYRTVKRLGIPDSQIILMLADDVACNPRNPFAGTVYSNADRKTDLYGEQIEVDYKGEEVTVETFLRLLSGRLPESTPASKRLMTDSRSNIFVYMTGHGGDEFLKFQDSEEISAFDIADAFGGMWAKKRYNEILFMVDTCQANTLYSKFYSPNILATGSSEKDQNSYSHHADNDIGVAVTDRYTHHVLTFLESINKTSQVPIQNLFDTFSHEIIRSTPGVRSDLFHRPLNETLLTDFFGGVSQVELSHGAEEGEGEPGAGAGEPGAGAGEPSALAPGALALRPKRPRRQRRRGPAPPAQDAAATTTLLAAQRALAPLAAVGLLHTGALLLGRRKRRRGAGPPAPAKMQSLRASTSKLAACACASSRRPFASTALARAAGPVVRSARKTPANTSLPQLKVPRALPAGAPATELFTGLVKTPAVRGRSTLINEESAQGVVKAWGVDRMEGVTVVEAYAGPGGLTRALLDLPNVKRVVAIEDAFRYLPFLNRMEERHPGRFTQILQDPFRWEAYSEVETSGLFDDVPTVPWDEVHPTLFFAAQIPGTSYGQQLFVQLVSAIAGQMWYFQKGRMQMGFVGPEVLWKKILAQPGDQEYHKLAVLLNSLAVIERTPTMGGLEPANLHFHRPRGDLHLMSPIKVTPREQPLVRNYDALEYVTRHMFVAKATAWHKAFSAISPGAGNLVPKLVELGVGASDPNKPVSHLTMQEWVKLADTFDTWPFRPQTLFDDFGFSEERI
ncbi:hypothetical protein JCM3770_000446 [Rhodotorula araucariae]